MTPPTHPGDRPSLRTFFSVLAVAGAVSALVVCAAVAVAPDSVRTPLACGAGVAAVVLSTAVATAVHALRTTRDVRHRLRTVTQDLGRLLQQQARTTEESRQEQQRLIDELARQRTELTETFEAERARLERESEQETNRLLSENDRLGAELERARRDRAAAVSATSNAAGRMQALATATLADLRAMEDRHSDEDVLADLLQLDHRTAQAGRLADSIAVLTGARSGRRWARPIAMESILRGAMGRIAGYQRVRTHSVSEAAVAGHAAEGVMHALAELLDNAANFSPPAAEVHVYVEEVPAGVIVSVEDSGLVMGDVQLRRAERAVSGDVSGLGGLTGTRLGLAVVGRIARKHGLKVSFRPSARGGTGVLMLIPQDILANPALAAAPAVTPPEQTPVPRRPKAPAAVESAPVHSTAATAPEQGPQQGAAGLPKRRRGRTLAEAERSRSAPRPGTTRSATGTDTPGPASGTDAGKARAARFSSFRRAVRPSAPEAPDTDRADDPATPDTRRAGNPATPDTHRAERPGTPDTLPAGTAPAAPEAGRTASAPGTPGTEGSTPAPDASTGTTASGRLARDGARDGLPDDRAGGFPSAPARSTGSTSAGERDACTPATAPAGHPADATRAPAPAGHPVGDAHATPRDGHGSGVPAATAMPGGPAPDGAAGGRAGVPQGRPGEHRSPASSTPHAHPEGDTTS
ncbi:histidine kinase [Streptomyces broussonetiae]|uniref:histidine kinase n=1 Tax=Streptomyces broussonetiae TaxID=2686304 RepID=A0A6I6NB57_9ACTN|nr:histidine kinase [Streptomyces broussonetiae]